MFDVLSIVFWGITYLLIVIYSVKNWHIKIRAISLLPPILNMSWEINALIVSRGFWGHIVWLGLDILVFICCIFSISQRKWRILYCLSLIPGVLVFFLLFNIDRGMYNYGMLLSSFAIDLIMAVCFFAERKKLLIDGKIIIAITKLLGDLSAVIFYAPYSYIVLITGICVFVLNIAYLVYAIKEVRFCTR